MHALLDFSQKPYSLSTSDDIVNVNLHWDRWRKTHENISNFSICKMDQCLDVAYICLFLFFNISGCSLDSGALNSLEIMVHMVIKKPQ